MLPINDKGFFAALRTLNKHLDCTLLAHIGAFEVCQHLSSYWSKRVQFPFRFFVPISFYLFVNSLPYGFQRVNLFAEFMTISRCFNVYLEFSNQKSVNQS